MCKPHILILQSVQKSFKLFKNSLLEITNEFAPMKTLIASKLKNLKWPGNEIKNIRKQKIDAHRK